MSLWKSTDANTSVPKFAPATVNLAPTQNNSNTLFGNTQVSAIVTNQAVGIFGVDTTEKSNTTGEGQKMAHAGWNLRRKGTGGIVSVAGSGGSGYSATGFMTITGGGLINTAANISFSNTNGTYAFTINNPGLYESTPTLTGPGGTSGTFTATMGGRANRVTYETLVAMGSMTGDASDDAILPE